MGGIFAFHADAERRRDLNSCAGAFLNALERRDGVLGSHERTASAAGARDESRWDR